MMTSFLKQFAQTLLQQHEKQMQHVHVIVPGKRAALFLKKHLFEVNQGPLIPPRIMILPEWLQTISTIQNIAGFESTLDLYKSYLAVAQEPEDFNAFMKWASHALNDFNDVDQYLVDGQQIFQNIKDIKAIDSWSLHQDPLSEVQQKFLQFWDELGAVYHHFQSESDAHNRWNYAQVARRLAEKKFEFHSDATHTYFVGLSRLTPAEEKVIALFQKANHSVSLHWDADAYYVHNPSHEAGDFFQKKIKAGETIPLVDCLSQGERKVKIWKSNTSLGASAILAKRLSQLSPQEREDTAVIITDNNSLLPLITHLHPEVPINVAIGWPLKNTGVYQLFASYIHFCVKSQKQNRIYHKDLTQWLEQPVLRNTTQSWRDSFLKKLIQKKRAYFTAADIADWITQDRDLQSMAGFLPFIDIVTTSSFDLIEKMNQLNQIILEDDKLDDITRECAWQWAEKWEKLNPALQAYDFLQSTSALEILIQYVLAKETIALEGEPLEGLQILGMIETRALDFKRVIFTQATEEVMPGQSPMQTLIPFELRKAFHMPMPGDREASYAYNFYRLLQRADQIEFYFPSSSSDFRSVEPSRYIQQLKWEWPLSNANIVFEEQNISLPASHDLDAKEVISADDFSRNQIKQQISRGLSPSAINKYLSCPLDFYYKYILGIGEINELDEQVDSAGMGTIIHAVLEKWHLTVLNVAMTLAHIQSWRKDLDQELLLQFQDGDQTVAVEGYNILAMEAAKKMIERVLDFDEKLIRNNTPPSILFTEKNYEHDLTLSDGTPVKLKGTLDRVHLCGGEYFILDYKTGKVDSGDLSPGDNEVANIFNGKKSKLTQILLYAYLAHHNQLAPLDKMQIGLFPLGKSEGEPLMLKNTQDMLNPTFMQEWENSIVQLIEGMLSRADFQHKEESQYCQFCRDAGR